MSSRSYDCIEIRPVAEDSSNLVDLKRLPLELSPTIFERVLSSRDRGVFIPELGCKVGAFAN